MPPKKVVKEEKLLLGRPSNNLKIGVVGLPNVGKSTFFNAVTNSAVSAENYPYCTINPEEARVAVPDERFEWLCDAYKPASKVPAYLTVLDIAGLMKGAHTGEGLGNQFLSHIQEVDAIFHVVRTFTDENVTHVEGEVDPIRDMEIIHDELRIKDAEFISNRLEALTKLTARMGKGGSTADKNNKEELEIVQKVLKHVQEDKRDVRHGDWNNKEVEIINGLRLLTAKPVIYLANIGDVDYIRKKNKWLPKIKNWIDKHSAGDLLVPLSASFEYEVSRKETAEEKDAFVKGKGATSALSKIIVAGYQALQLIYFFTCGPDEVRAWTVRKMTKAPKAAGVIHTDFEKGFILAEVMKYNDLKELENETAVKAAGKYLQKGKEYIVEDGDIIYFRSGLAHKK